MSTILVVTELREGALRSINHEVYTAAAHLSQQTGQPAAALMLGAANLDAVAQAPGQYGIPRTILVEDPALSPYSPDCYAAVIAEVARREDAGVLLMGASFTGKDLMARVAHRLGTSLAQDCISFRVDGGEITFTRPLFAGKVLADVKVTSRPVMATLRPKAHKPVEAPVAVAVERVQVATPAPLAVVEAFQKSASAKMDVTEADVIVSGGRGLQGPENWGILEELADVLDAATACSRPVSDDGWRPHDEHVGQTGKTVSPDLYIACGISGAIQHVAGVSSSKYIVAINKDPEAPIFNVADYGIVGDLFEVVPALTEAVKRLKAEG